MTATIERAATIRAPIKRARWRNLYFTRSDVTYWGRLIHATKKRARAASDGCFADWHTLGSDEFWESPSGLLIPFQDFRYAIPLPVPKGHKR